MLFNSRRVKTEQPLPFSKLAFLASSSQISNFGVVQQEFQINGVKAPIHRLGNSAQVICNNRIKNDQSQFSRSSNKKQGKYKQKNTCIWLNSSSANQSQQCQNNQNSMFIPNSDRIRRSKIASRFYIRKQKFKESVGIGQFQIKNSLRKGQLLSKSPQSEQKSPKNVKPVKAHRSLTTKQIKQIPVLMSFYQMPQPGQQNSIVLKEKMVKKTIYQQRMKSQQIQSPLYLKPRKIFNNGQVGSQVDDIMENNQKWQLLKLKQTIRDNSKWNTKKPGRTINAVKLKNDRLLQAFS